jgi:hypothetical protein
MMESKEAVALMRGREGAEFRFGGNTKERTRCTRDEKNKGKRILTSYVMLLAVTGEQGATSPMLA